MGTRSVTIVIHESGQELVRVYRQFDGYPDGHGLELAALCDRMIVNGIPGTVFKLGPDGLPTKDENEYHVSNGMSELAAQIVMGLKNNNKIGNIYLEAPQGPVNDWAEYIYIVSGTEGQKPTIECRTHVGDPPFNLQTEEGLVFKGTSEEWVTQGKKGFSKDE